MNAASFSDEIDATPLTVGAMDSPKGEVRIGAWIAGLFFAGFLGWAALTPLDAGALAQGSVAVSGNRQAVQHRDGGIVTALMVQEGREVRQGDVLLKISASDAVATERGLTGEIVALLAQRARLIAERDGARQLVEPAEFRTYLAGDEVLAREAMRGQRLLFDARRRSIETERGVLGQRIAQHNRQIAGYGHQIQSNRTQQRLIGEELSGLKTLSERGFVSLNRIRSVERNAAQLDGDFGALGSDVARLEEAIGESRLQMVSMDRQMLEEVATQLREVQVRLDELQPKLFATRERLTQSVVRAPASGRVVGLKVFTVGGVVAPGEMLMEVVPQDKALVVKAKASPNDADDLSPGMATQVRFSGIQERSLPILSGKITKISADSFEDERTGMQYFEIEVVVSPAELSKITVLRGPNALRAGMPAEVMIPLRKRSALTYLIEPLTQTLWKAGREH
ncbi:HlyD family type I secretion periplasmic adaptor subunit [Sphingopyxis sp.]|jgi:HlyD family secretion protein|uniref:HlyD family type I secretion periplasmic adaptor subunit n=1 Tax=Sphingopyxis sp. TaxID=1908224 RepID=UPI002DEC01EE|nr:HlyD family type I secretion periplasmic adaptor subunit [Sphingopyxis sp.]